MTNLLYIIAERYWQISKDEDSNNAAVLYEIASQKKDCRAYFRLYEITKDNPKTKLYRATKSPNEYLELAMLYGSARAYEEAFQETDSSDFYLKLLFLSISIKLLQFSEDVEKSNKLIDIFINESKGISIQFIEDIIFRAESWEIGEELNRELPNLVLLHPNSILNDKFIHMYGSELDDIEYHQNLFKLHDSFDFYDLNNDESDFIRNDTSTNKLIRDYEECLNNIYLKRLYDSAHKGNAVIALYIYTNKLGPSFRKMKRQAAINGHPDVLHEIIFNFIDKNLNKSDFKEFDYSGFERHSDHVFFLLYFAGLLQKIGSVRCLNTLEIQCTCLDSGNHNGYRISTINLLEFKYERCSYFELKEIDYYLSKWSPGKNFHELFLISAKNLGVSDFEEL